MAASENLHANSDMKTGSDRSFGIVFAIFFSIIGLYPLLDGNPVRKYFLIAAAVFLFFAIVFPKILGPLNKLWLKFGIALSTIMNPIIFSLIYFTVVTPIAVFMRLRGKNFLSLKFEPEAASYWIQRDPPGPKADSLKKQF